MKKTNKAIEDATNLLAGLESDSESYHSTFDNLIEERFNEFDPEFMKAMSELYDKSGASRWCA
jgi:molecular chaperone GrpE (heat shock protein)